MECTQEDGKIRHPANAMQWKLYENHPEFSRRERNIQFALSTDGMIHFGQMRNPYNTWSMIPSLYNFSSWLCHKSKYLILTTLMDLENQVTT